MGKEDADTLEWRRRHRVKNIQIYQAAAFSCFGCRVALLLKARLTVDFFLSAKVRVGVECRGGGQALYRETGAGCGVLQSR
jgi:hypothetical protein